MVRPNVSIPDFTKQKNMIFWIVKRASAPDYTVYTIWTSLVVSCRLPADRLTTNTFCLGPNKCSRCFQPRNRSLRAYLPGSPPTSPLLPGGSLDPRRPSSLPAALAIFLGPFSSRHPNSRKYWKVGYILILYFKCNGLKSYLIRWLSCNLERCLFCKKDTKPRSNTLLRLVSFFLRNRV